MNTQGLLQAIVTIMVLGATIGLLFTKTSVPEWWPPLAVAVVGYTFGIRNGTLRGPGQ